ncbi:MAG TPA: hypothetical protein VEM13_07470, partial [Gemmatimonadales bacterium]|nr:hypothetical protein [Gemmatimonadales bacterium]
RFTIGPGRIRQALRGGRQPPLGLPAPAFPPNPVTTLLGMRDALRCTPEQVAQLQVIADSLDVRNRLLPESLDAVLRLAAERDNAQWALDRVRAVLTAEQWDKVPTALKSPGPALND